MSNKKTFKNVGQINEGKNGEQYIKLSQYKQKTSLAMEIGTEKYDQIDVCESTSGSPKVLAELKVKVGVIMKGKNGSFIVLNDGARFVIDGELQDVETAGLGEPHKESPDFVLNDVYLSLDN